MRYLDMNNNRDDRRIDIVLIVLMAMLGIGMLLIGNKPLDYTIGLGSLAICYIWGYMATHNKP